MNRMRCQAKENRRPETGTAVFIDRGLVSNLCRLFHKPGDFSGLNA